MSLTLIMIIMTLVVRAGLELWIASFNCGTLIIWPCCLLLILCFESERHKKQLQSSTSFHMNGQSTLTIADSIKELTGDYHYYLKRQTLELKGDKHEVTALQASPDQQVLAVG